MEYWLWLRTIKGLGPIIGKRLLARFGNPREIYAAGKDELLAVKGVGDVLATAIALSRSLEKAISILDECAKKGIKILTYNDPLYPLVAKSPADAPFLLYYKGRIKNNIEGVAVVGARRCSDYGKEIALSAAKYLAANNIPVISGMAKGIDGYSHTSCLKNGGYTIAFLGNGLDICYPSEHKSLMDAIAGQGVIISEYPPGTRPHAEHFPRRNLLVSSWSKKVLVVEAAEKSGALITASIALKQGKELYVPPHEIYSNAGKGSNKLLLSGATIYLHPSQLLTNTSPDPTGNPPRGNDPDPIKASGMGPVKGSSAGPTKANSIIKAPLKVPKLTSTPEASATDKKILDCLAETAKTIEEIKMDLQMNLSDLIEHISILELEGKISTVAGGRYRVM